MKLLVLGLGNVLLRDDGVGVRAVEALAARHRAPEGVELVDGGTLGMGLLGLLADAEIAILVDAVRARAPAGTVVRFEGDDVPQAVLERLSPHQIGLADLLTSARLIGRYPGTLVLCGVVADRIELGLGLSEPVEAALPALVASVVEECRRLGYPLVDADVAA
jgi:hydrogenase maturation protease